MDLNDIFRIPIIIPFIVGIINFRKLNIGHRWLLAFVGYGVANEISSTLLLYLGGPLTMAQRYLYNFITFLLLGMLYDYFLKDFFRKRWILIVVLVYEIFYIINALFIQDINEYPALANSLGAIIIVLFAILYFYKIMNEARILKLSSEPMVWINTSILIYYSGILFFYVLFNLMYKHSPEFGKLTFVYFNIQNTLLYILIAIGFWKVNSAKS